LTEEAFISKSILTRFTSHFHSQRALQFIFLSKCSVSIKISQFISKHNKNAFSVNIDFPQVQLPTAGVGSAHKSSLQFSERAIQFFM
jgi:hypothetical protein